MKIPWSLNLTNESGFIIALLAGLIVGNFLPGVAKSMKEAIRPELYIKTAIVILGGFLGIAALEQRALATSVMFRGVCAIVEAYLIYWPIVYFVARAGTSGSAANGRRRWPPAFRSAECRRPSPPAAPSRRGPIVPIMVSSLVVIFAVVELMILPFAAQHWLYNQPMVAGAWMGLAVKTDGAAVASGAIADSLIRAKAMAMTGVNYAPDWIMGVSTTVKVFIDIFIGVWAFILAWVWSAKIERREGEKVKASADLAALPEVHPRLRCHFPARAGHRRAAFRALVPKVKAAMGQANVFRAIFFVMTFFTIGVVSNFRKLWEEGIAKLAGVYVLCLFGFIIWVGLLISWLFFHGVLPPIVKG